MGAAAGLVPTLHGMETVLDTSFWMGLFQIVWIDIILSGDNAVVIALAARSLPPRQQRRAIFWGTGFAVVMRVMLAVVAAKLMQLPFLQIIGGCLLLWIGVGLLKGEDGNGGEDTDRRVVGGGMLAAIRTILLADMVMCLDNVIAVAAAARGDIVLLALGLAISIPLVIFSSTLMIKLMARFPAIVLLGAALIGWVAGGTIAHDAALADWTGGHPAVHYAAAALGALLVVGLGRLWRQRRQRLGQA